MKTRFSWGKREVQAKGTPANETLAKLAETLVQDVGSQGGKLDYTHESLRLLDAILANYGVGNADQNMGAVELAGAYFGEVLRRNLGGQWHESVPPDNATGLLLDEKSEVWVWCHSIVYKGLQQGNKCLYEIYGDIAYRLPKVQKQNE